MFAYVATIAFACFVRVATPLRTINRDLWSCACRCISVIWFLTILSRSLERCGDRGWQPLTTPDANPFSAVVRDRGLNQCMPVDLAYFPVAQIVYYLSEVAWIFAQPRETLRKDDHVLLAHHVVTTLLIGFWGVYLHGYWLSTLLPTLHDVNDVFIDLAKYLKRRGDISSKLIDICFGLFVLSWMYTRVYYIPSQFLPQLWNDPDGPLIPFAYFGFSLLILLQFAQAYWTLLILRAVWRAVVTSQLEDERGS